jgi:hypothetical protein
MGASWIRLQVVGGAGLLALVAAGVGGAEPVGAILPGIQRDGAVLLPNQWTLRPVGRQVAVGDFPANLALHPDGRHAAVLHCGWGQHEVRILEVKTGKLVSAATLNEAFYGLAWAPDGGALYASGAGLEAVYAFAFRDGYLSARRTLPLRAGKERGVPAGLAVSADGRALYVAEVWGQRVLKIATGDGAPVWARTFAPPQGARQMAPDENRHRDRTGDRAFGGGLVS